MLATSSACFPQGPRSLTSKKNPSTCCFRAVRSVVEDEVVGSGDEGGDGVGDKEI